MLKLYPKTEEEARDLIEDYEFLGYKTSLKNNVLSVWWGTTQKKAKQDKTDKPARNKRLDKRSRD